MNFPSYSFSGKLYTEPYKTTNTIGYEGYAYVSNLRVPFGTVVRTDVPTRLSTNVYGYIYTSEALSINVRKTLSKNFVFVANSYAYNTYNADVSETYRKFPSRYTNGARACYRGYGKLNYSSLILTAYAYASSGGTVTAASASVPGNYTVAGNSYSYATYGCSASTFYGYLYSEPSCSPDSKLTAEQYADFVVSTDYIYPSFPLYFKDASGGVVRKNVGRSMKNTYSFSSPNNPLLQYLDEPGYYQIHIAGYPGYGNPYYYVLDMLLYCPGAQLLSFISGNISPSYIHSGGQRLGQPSRSYCGLFMNTGASNYLYSSNDFFGSSPYAYFNNSNMASEVNSTCVAYAPFTARVQIDGTLVPDDIPIPSYSSPLKKPLPFVLQNKTSRLPVALSGGPPVIVYCVSDVTGGMDWSDTGKSRCDENTLLCVVPGTGGCGGELFAVDHEFTEEDFSCYPRFVPHPFDVEEDPRTGLPFGASLSWRNSHPCVTQTYGKGSRLTGGQYNIRQYVGFEGGAGGLGFIGGLNGVPTATSAIWSEPFMYDIYDAYPEWPPGTKYACMPTTVPLVLHPGIGEITYPKVTKRKGSVTVNPSASTYVFTDTYGFIRSANCVSPRFFTSFYCTNDLPGRANHPFIPTTAGQDGAPFIQRRGKMVYPYGGPDFGDGVAIMDYQVSKKALDPKRFVPVKVVRDTPSGPVYEMESIGRAFSGEPAEEYPIVIKYLGAHLSAPLWYF